MALPARSTATSRSSSPLPASGRSRTPPSIRWWPRPRLAGLLHSQPGSAICNLRHRRSSLLFCDTEGRLWRPWRSWCGSLGPHRRRPSDPSPVRSAEQSIAVFGGGKCLYRSGDRQVTPLSRRRPALLDSEPGAVACASAATSYAAGETPIEFRRSLYPADRFSYRRGSSGPGRAGRPRALPVGGGSPKITGGSGRRRSAGGFRRSGSACRPLRASGPSSPEMRLHAVDRPGRSRCRSLDLVRVS